MVVVVVRMMMMRETMKQCKTSINGQDKDAADDNGLHENEEDAEDGD